MSSLASYPNFDPSRIALDPNTPDALVPLTVSSNARLLDSEYLTSTKELLLLQEILDRVTIHGCLYSFLDYRFLESNKQLICSCIDGIKNQGYVYHGPLNKVNDLVF